jgi:hypothetical protein
VLPALRLPLWLRSPAPIGDPLAASPAGSLHRFAEAVRAATPETDGFANPVRRPAYGILCPPNVGHALRYTARRAMVIDNFGPYLDPPHFGAAHGFYVLGREERAVELMESLGAPYVVTMEYGPLLPASVASRLQRRDGLATGEEPALARFRLITEGPAGGRALTELFGVPTPPGTVPYKLWQAVAGARVEVDARPGAEVEASLPIVTPAGRRFRYRTHALADADGIARLRLPYATDARHPARAAGRLRVVADGVVRHVSVTDRDVLEGAVVAVRGGAS